MSIARKVFVAFGPGFLKCAWRERGKSRSHACSLSMLDLFPTSSRSCLGAYLLVHSWPAGASGSGASARAACWIFFSSSFIFCTTLGSSAWAPRSAISARKPSSVSVRSLFFWITSSFFAPAFSPRTTYEVLDEGALVTFAP